MFKTRLLSGIILVAAALFLVISGGNILLFSLLAISLAGMFELYRVAGIEKTLAGYAGYLAAILWYLDIWHGFLPDAMAFAIGILVLLMAIYVFTYPKYKTEQIFAAYFGIFYVSVMLSYLYRIRMSERGAYVVWLVFLCSWGCDTCAYCVGVLFGKHKMSPKLSPKKSIEGAVGGVAGSMLLTLIYTWVFREPMQMDTEQMLLLALAAGAGALISMVGDLAASAIKRNYDIKDYGRLIPGHGGILDRFDSVIFTAPAIYYLADYLL